MKRIVTFTVLLLACAAASAQTTQITASNISKFGGAKVTGQFCVTPTDSSGNPINLTTPAGQQFAPSTSLCFPIVNGVLSAYAIVPDTSLAQPANACYKLTVSDNQGNQIGTYPCIQPSGTSWSFDAYVPSTLPSTTALSLPQFQVSGVPIPNQGVFNLIPGANTSITPSAGGVEVSSTGATVNLASPGAIGGTTPSSGAFTTVSGAVTDKGGTVYNIKAYGAICDGAHQSADTTALTNAVADAGAAGGAVFIPPGTCNFNNSSAAFTITGFSGVIEGTGKTSNIVFSSTVNAGFLVTASNNITIRDLQLSYGTPATARNSSYGPTLNITTSTNILLDDLYISGSPLACALLSENNHMYVHDMHVTGCMANGVQTANNNDLHLANTSCLDDGDACEEYDFYDSESSYTCQGITSTGMRSEGDANGFIVDGGCKNVSVTNFNIDNTWNGGLIVEQTTNNTTTTFPDDIVISNGSVTNSGYGSSVGTGTTPSTVSPCMYFEINTSTATISHVSVSNIGCRNLKGVGVNVGSINARNNWDIDFSNVRVFNNGTGTASPAWLLWYCDLCTVANSNAYNASQQSAYVGDGQTVIFNNFTSVNPNQNGAGIVAAVQTDASMFGTVSFQGLNLYDTWATTSRSEILDGASGGSAHAYNNIVKTITGTWQGCSLAYTTNQTCSFQPLGPQVSVITSGTAQTYTTPANALYLKVQMCGGGGGGSGSGTTPSAATNGAASTFGSLTASYGSLGSTSLAGGAGGTATGGDLNMTGGAGGTGNAVEYLGGAPGGSSFFGGAGIGGLYDGSGGAAAANSCSGGGGGGESAVNSTGAGGGAGGYLEKTIKNPSSSYTYTVGAAGAGGGAGTSGFAGGNGGAGIIIVTAYFQ